MSKSLFFNAAPDASSATGYDRNYNADDLSDFLSMVCDTGVVKANNDSSGKPQGLKVVAATGMAINVNAGKASIKGKAFINDALERFTISANGTAANRYDYIVIKYDNNVSVRDINLELRTGTSTIPTVSSLTRTEKVYELMLAYITVAPSATSITQANITDTRGKADLCPWFTAAKGYDDYYDAIVEKHESTVTLTEISKTVTTDLPSTLYNKKYSLVEVYTNGLKEPETAYTASFYGGYGVIEFKAQKGVGTKVTVVLSNYIDGEGMGTVLEQYTQLVKDVADLKTVGEYNYVCTGDYDNIAISNIAQSFANNSAISDDARITIKVYGNFGAASAQGGAGTSTDPYRWFSVGTATTSNKRITVDFSGCKVVNLPLVANTYNTIIFGSNTHIKGLNLKANCTGLGCHVRLFFNANGGEVTAEDCYFESVTTGSVLISKGGTFINCNGYLSSANDHAYCFLMENNNQPIVVLGGKYRAYTASADTSIMSAIVYASSGATNAVCVLNGVNCPTVAKTAFYQKNCIRVNSGYFTSNGLITALDNASASAATVSMTGTIPLSRP